MTFYFYDLETSGGNPRTARIMQFAGQRTNEDLQLIGEPDNILIRLSDDVIPEPDATLVHGITPQKTVEEGITEAEFAEYFHDKVAQPETVFVGFNNIRFDDEFTRRLCYRTFYDPYQWHWRDGRSRWDLLDPFRMMRALRPDGLRWPTIDGKPTVKLELLAKENAVEHENAHDALSDVQALIELAQKFKATQPRLFDYLLTIRDKKAVAALVEAGQPFVYTSGRYNSAYQKTTIVELLFKHPRRDGAIVYNLREDPEEWFAKTPDELVRHWRPPYGDTETKRLPVKTMQYNRCPAVAPLSVLDDDSKQRVNIDDAHISRNRRKIKNNKEFTQKLQKALDTLEHEQQGRLELGVETVDDQMYNGFWTGADESELLKVRMADPDDFMKLQPEIKNKRIRDMMPLYKARNYPQKLTDTEREQWEAYRKQVFSAGGKQNSIAKFSKRMQELGNRTDLTSKEEYLLTELQLYVESIIPINSSSKETD